MKKSRLIIAAIALMGIAACGKIETPNVQEEPEVIAPEVVVAAESEQAAQVKSVACTINTLCKINEVREFIKSLIIDVNKSEEPWHIDFSIASPNEEVEYPYIAGTIGFTKGVFHPIVLDMDLMVMGALTIQGTLDVRQIVSNYAHALKHLDDYMGDITAQFYLDKANEGIDVLFADAIKLCFMVAVDEEGNRSIDLYLYSPDDPDIPMIPVPSLLDIITIRT